VEAMAAHLLYTPALAGKNHLNHKGILHDSQAADKGLVSRITGDSGFVLQTCLQVTYGIMPEVIY
jgi:hypothetical protein